MLFNAVRTQQAQHAKLDERIIDRSQTKKEAGAPRVPARRAPCGVPRGQTFRPNMVTVTNADEARRGGDAVAKLSKSSFLEMLKTGNAKPAAGAAAVSASAVR
jgi:hypothetical protein